MNYFRWKIDKLLENLRSVPYAICKLKFDTCQFALLDWKEVTGKHNGNTYLLLWRSVYKCYSNEQMSITKRKVMYSY